MANRRIRKKQLERKARNAAAEGEAPSPFAPRTMKLSLPCPECRRFTLMRTYLPALGSMNGSVECWRCDYKDQFVNALASDMNAADPVPVTFRAPRNEKTTPPELLAPPSIWREMYSALAVHVRAAARFLKTPEQRPHRRLERAHSTVG